MNYVTGVRQGAYPLVLQSIGWSLQRLTREQTNILQGQKGAGLVFQGQDKTSCVFVCLLSVLSDQLERKKMLLPNQQRKDDVTCTILQMS